LDLGLEKGLAAGVFREKAEDLNFRERKKVVRFDGGIFWWFIF
jgi:hypothetical protein